MPRPNRRYLHVRTAAGGCRRPEDCRLFLQLQSAERPAIGVGAVSGVLKTHVEHSAVNGLGGTPGPVRLSSQRVLCMSGTADLQSLVVPRNQSLPPHHLCWRRLLALPRRLARASLLNCSSKVGLKFSSSSPGRLQPPGGGRGWGRSCTRVGPRRSAARNEPNSRVRPRTARARTTSSWILSSAAIAGVEWGLPRTASGSRRWARSVRHLVSPVS